MAISSGRTVRIYFKRRAALSWWNTDQHYIYITYIFIGLFSESQAVSCFDKAAVCRVRILLSAWRTDQKKIHGLYLSSAAK